jgi:multidrug transporter EmrE-like cation transporter
MTRPQIGLIGLVFIFVSALLHLLYFFVLQRGYSKGDLSLVYPLARGTGPMLSSCAAVLVFGERPGLLAILGAILVIFIWNAYGNPNSIRGSFKAQDYFGLYYDTRCYRAINGLVS